jgi:hypothetical protein
MRAKKKKPYRIFEVGSISEMNRKLKEALIRLGEPDRNYRAERDRRIRLHRQEKDHA